MTDDEYKINKEAWTLAKDASWEECKNIPDTSETTTQAHIFKVAVQWRDNNPSPEVLALVENFQNAYDYMCSSGYDKADPEEPEYQMLDCFRKALLEWDKK